MDPLSEMLSLLEASSYVAAGFQIRSDTTLRFGAHAGIKCYALGAGRCWLAVDGEEPILLETGDCMLLARGRPFRLGPDLARPAVDAGTYRRAREVRGEAAFTEGAGPSFVGGFFRLEGRQAPLVLETLPPVVHLREAAQTATMRFSLERLREEVTRPQPGSTLLAQQLAFGLLVQALRLAAPRTAGWLADERMGTALSCMHADPAHPWTVKELAGRVGMSRSVFALRFKETVGVTPIEYLTRWRVQKASVRLRRSDDSISAIAESLGYESDSAFRRAFRGVMGCSPREYGRAR